jgi:hypothetical protein
MKSDILYFPDKKSLMDFYKKIMETESHHSFLIKRRYHRKTRQYSILIKEKPKLSINNDNFYKDDIEMSPKRDLVDEVNDRLNYRFGGKLEKQIYRNNYRENWTYSRWDKNIYCDICGKYQTKDEYKKYKMCKKCYDT